MRKFIIYNVQCTIKLTLLVFTFYILHFTFYITPAYAQTPSPGFDIGDKFGFGSITSLGEATTKLVNPVFSVATAIVIIYFLWGAFNYIISEGKKEEVEAARQIITHAIIGFMILMFAFFILQFLPQFLNLPGLDIIK